MAFLEGFSLLGAMPGIDERSGSFLFDSATYL
jgi:hypothetical protein